jgi:hypothetical protein
MELVRRRRSILNHVLDGEGMDSSLAWLVLLFVIVMIGLIAVFGVPNDLNMPLSPGR